MSAENLESRLKRMNRTGYQRQRTRTVLGVRLTQVGEGGGWWMTDDRRFKIELREGGGCEWTLFDADRPICAGNPTCHGSLKSAVREILRRVA